MHHPNSHSTWVELSPLDLRKDEEGPEEKYSPPRRAFTEPTPTTRPSMPSTARLTDGRVHVSPARPTVTSNETSEKRRGIWGIVSPFWFLFSLGTVTLTIVSWVLHFVLGNRSPTAVFVSAFSALLLQAYILGYATEQLSLSSGEKVAALLNVSFGNAVELIVAIVALTKCELEVVQSSLVGSVFSNLLLVTGMALIAGGLRHGVQRFSSEEAQLQSALLVFACCSVLFPTVSYLLQSFNQSDLSRVGNSLHVFSRGSAIVSIMVYGCFLVYSMKKSKVAPIANERDSENTHIETEEEEDEEPSIGRLVALLLLLGTTAVVGITAEFLVSSLDGMTSEGPLSKQFVSVILLPIVGNAAEHCSAVMLAVKNKTRMCLDIAVGSSLQISLFVLPVSVILGWIMGRPLTFFLDPLQSVILLVSVILVSFIIQDGKSNWMEGVLLFALFVNLCVAFQVYSGFGPNVAVNGCT
ncbi:calcium/proton exchanger [Dendrothele bispora CBS 962.96]|uniref:Vacuolar calcium ion transporter n=1 Tax=Dendrothele bispora (strain CBS 962.96) TaxID=1314807 RepID=A0A4S8MVI0_DENBC|nr:calcium/proton exchanger [Dendrothele bispora CBS 962.96]